MLKRCDDWLHRRRWARRNLRQMREADAIIISHTKSGRTWLRVMISHLYHLRYGTPERELLQFDNLHHYNAAIPRIYFTRDTRIPTFWRRGITKRIPTDKKFLFLVRDPRDVAVSFYFHVRHRAGQRELDRKGIPNSARELPIYDFVMDRNLGITRVIDHMNRWHKEMEGMPQSLVIRYEDLRAQTVQTLERIMAFLNTPFDPADLARAVEFASFENLVRRESEGFFEGNRLGAKESGDRDTYKVRRGKVGGFKDYFTQEQVEKIEHILHSTLDPFYGYS
jgi:hypothetical protein